MPRGAYTAKQDRKAEHIEEGYEKRGVSKKEAESRAWATVNKQDKGGKNDGSGRSPQPQRRRQEGLGNPAQALEIEAKVARSRISSARSIARSSLCARRSSRARGPSRRAAGWRAGPCPNWSGAARAGGGWSGSASRSTRPARTRVSTERLTAGAPRPTAAATWLRVAGSLAPIAASSLRRARSARSAGPSATQF